MCDIEGSFQKAPCVSPKSPGSTSPTRGLNKETKVTINGVTFPLTLGSPAQPLLKPGDWSYCDYFWKVPERKGYMREEGQPQVPEAIRNTVRDAGSGKKKIRAGTQTVKNRETDKKDPQGTSCITGFEVLLQKQLKGKQLQKEMAEFIRERIKIEEDYAKNLAKLSQVPLAAGEEGTLGEAWNQLKHSLADEAEVHLRFSCKLHSEVEKPLLSLRDNFKKDMKKYDQNISELRKQLLSRYVGVEKARKALTDRQKDLEVKTQQLEVKLSNKTEVDIKKARRKSTQAGDELMRCIDLYNQAQCRWFEEMVTSSMELEKLEVDRVKTIRQHLCRYTMLRRETDMFSQSMLEPVDQLLKSVDPARDRQLWVIEHMTGQIRPVDLDL